MNTRLLMVASSLALGLAGIMASFAPVELLRMLRSPAAGSMPVMVQLLGGLYLAFALTNWTAKGSLIGGIYARPISVGNAVHFLTGSLALTKQQLSQGVHLPLMAALILYVVFALCFLWLVFGRGAAVTVASAERLAKPNRTEQDMKPEGTDQDIKPVAASTGAVVLPPRPEPEKQPGLVRKYLQHLKDEVLEAVIQRMVKEKLAPFGELKECEVDTHANSIAGQVLMKGEAVPIRVTITCYEVIEVDDHHFIELKRFTSSKEWVQAVMDRFLTDKRFKLPIGVAPLI